MKNVQSDQKLDKHAEVLDKVKELYLDLFVHNGFGQIKIEMRFLKKGQKEVLINCGKEYRYVLNYTDQEWSS